MSHLKIENLIKSYNNDLPVLKDVCFSVEKGEIYGIIGPSGAGKSTLLRLLTGLVRPSSGKIYLEGDEIGQMDERHLRKVHLEMGMIFQHFNLMSAKTALENVLFPLKIAKVLREKRLLKAKELLQFVGLENKMHCYPATLSGGEKQRVGIARALANDPKTLFCDEATSALDPQAVQEVLSLLTSINKQFGITIVLITHDMEVIKSICHKVAVLEKGQLIEEGKVEEVFMNPTHPTTKKFIQKTAHKIPAHFFKTPSETRKLLRLSFKEGAASQPLISQMVKQFDLEANILLGWIDQLKQSVVGTLVVEFTGKKGALASACTFLKDHQVHIEELIDAE